MRKMICAIVLSLMVLTGCTSNQDIGGTSAGNTIKVEDKIFSGTVDDCIGILNEHIAEEGLSLIPEEYDIVEEKNGIIYESKINDRLKVRFEELKNYGIMRIGLSYLNEAKYDNPNKKETYNVSDEKRKEAVKYYKIICKTIEPSFNPKKFLGVIGKFDANATYDGSTYVKKDRVYNCASRSISGDGGRESVFIYEVISSEELYDKYGEDIDQDMTVFFKPIKDE